MSPLDSCLDALLRYSNGQLELLIVPAVCFLLPALVLTWKVARALLRRRRLYAKYGRTDIGDKVVRRVIWAGETGEQVLDSLGPPLAVDTKLMRTRSRETWKYHRRGGARFDTRITFDDGIVVAWDLKRNG